MTVDSHSHTVTEANFAGLAKGDIVLLDFWASWCGPCRTFGPIFEAAAAKHADITFGKVNTEEQPALAAAFSIRSIPTLMVLREGVLLYKQAGALPKAALESLIEKVRAIDMSEVRRELASIEAEERRAAGGV